MEIYSVENVRKSFIAEVFVRAMKNQTYRDIKTSICKNVYNDLLNDAVELHCL